MLDRAVKEKPHWTRLAGIGGAIGVTAVGSLTFIASLGHVERPVVVGLLLAVAVSPFVLELWRDLPPPLLAVWVLVPIGMINLLASPLGTSDSQGRAQSSLMIVVWLIGQTAAIARRRDVILVTGAGLAIVIGRSLIVEELATAFIWVAGIGIALLAGLLIRALVEALLNAQLAQAALSEQATLAERQRIAREVHDVIAHSLTVTMLHLTAARLAVGRGDSASATEALEEAERAGRSSLGEIRRTVGLLSANSNGPRDAPQPSAVDVPALVAGYRAAGVEVDLEIRGDIAVVDAAVGLAVYRIVQESLANAAKHAPGARGTVRVEVADPIAVEVWTNGPSSGAVGAGMGLAGMRERAVALGGSCVAGPDPGGWRVSARLPSLPVEPSAVEHLC